jgi:hypothetical protein
MISRSLLLILFLFVTVELVQAKTFCACCAEPGTYMLSTGKPEKFQIDLLKEIGFDKHAFLYMTEAGFDSIKGLSTIEKEFDSEAWIASPGDFDMVNTFTGKLWTFGFKTPKGTTGTLKLPIPTQMVTYKVDIHDEEGRPNGPLLYKEFRFKGTVSLGTGFLSKSIVKPTSYFLVFQGRGNGCDDVSDFRNWMLELAGPRARYQFFGKLEGARNDTDRNARMVTPPSSLLTP